MSDLLAIRQVSGFRRSRPALHAMARSSGQAGAASSTGCGAAQPLRPDRQLPGPGRCGLGRIDDHRAGSLAFVGPARGDRRPLVGTHAGHLRGRARGELARRGNAARFSGGWTGIDDYQAGEPLTVVTGPDGSVTALNTGSFIYTRTPYDPAAPVPGGVDADGC